MTARRRLVALALVAAGCATGGKLRSTQAVLQGDVEKARKSGAERCAPKELAIATANLDFATAEIDLGNASRAEQHLKLAETNIRKALDQSQDCGPKQLTIGKAAPAVVIEKTDRDGDGVPDVDDACPDVPGPPENKGCPVVKDTDGDGIPDDVDKGPLDPEDKAGFQDDDGCPDPDNDNDGIVDAMDACPNNPGPIENRGCPVLDRDGDGIPDALDRCPDEPGLPPDGCPRKYSLVEVKKDRIQIRQQVHFATRKYKVLKSSFRLLNQVVQVLNDYPKMRVRIEGHTDRIGGESFNLKLSQKRAEAVRGYLIAKGVSPDRLEAAGFGLTRPIASNKTAKGRAQNRRTEFHIVSMGE